jgi:hypothetical protein
VADPRLPWWESLGKRAFDPADPVAGRAWTDAEGRFELRRLRPEESYEVRASRAGSFPAGQRVTLGDAMAAPRSLTLVLAPARAAQGKVQDAQGKPIAGAEAVVVSALRPEASRGPSLDSTAAPDAVTAPSDGQGIFRIAARAWSSGWLPPRAPSSRPGD